MYLYVSIFSIIHFNGYFGIYLCISLEEKLGESVLQASKQRNPPSMGNVNNVDENGDDTADTNNSNNQLTIDELRKGGEEIQKQLPQYGK